MVGETSHIEWRYARAGGKRAERPLRRSQLVAGCGEGVRRRRGNGDHRAARRRSRPFEGAGARESRQATVRDSRLVAEPPGTRLGFFVSCNYIRDIRKIG